MFHLCRHSIIPLELLASLLVLWSTEIPHWSQPVWCMQPAQLCWRSPKLIKSWAAMESHATTNYQESTTNCAKITNHLDRYWNKSFLILSNHNISSKETFATDVWQIFSKYFLQDRIVPQSAPSPLHILTPHAPTHSMSHAATPTHPHTHTNPVIFTISVTQGWKPCLSDFKTLKIQLYWLIIYTLKIICGILEASL